MDKRSHRRNAVKRRSVVLGLAAIAGAARSAHAQKVARIGYLAAGDLEPSWTLFRTAMAELGYAEGRRVTYVLRADTGPRLDEFARELVAAKPDLLVPVLAPAITAAQRATSTIPIVFNGGAPVIGAVANVARPEGNLTGAFTPSTIIAGKGLQLFHELRPDAERIGLLYNVLDPFHVPLKRDVEAAALTEKLECVPLLIKPDGIAAAFEELASRKVGGVFVQPTLGLKESAVLALKHRLPSFTFRREFAEAGGLMSYGADQVEISRFVAGHVDRILKGARPGDLPVQQATKFELVLNQKTARALGIVFPPLFLARADEVIE